jgi:hypothetical protein
MFGILKSSIAFIKELIPSLTNDSLVKTKLRSRLLPVLRLWLDQSESSQIESKKKKKRKARSNYLQSKLKYFYYFAHSR